MKYVLAGRTYEIKDLDPTLDAMFAQLHAAYLGPTPLPWDQFKAVAAAFLAGSPPRSSQHNDYFDNFTIIWNQLLSNGRYDDAEMLWQMALAPRWKQSDRTPIMRSIKVLLTTSGPLPQSYGVILTKATRACIKRLKKISQQLGNISQMHPPMH
jgi:hypothetical protein